MGKGVGRPRMTEKRCEGLGTLLPVIRDFIDREGLGIGTPEHAGYEWLRDMHLFWKEKYEIRWFRDMHLFWKEKYDG